MSEGIPRIEGYRVGRLVGHGGMAAVYEAWRESDGLRLAIKVIAHHLAADPDFRRRFAREADVASQLDHPHAVKLVDSRIDPEAGGFLAMEFIEGPNLQERLAVGGPLPVTAATRIIDQVAAALDEAHRLGLVHRDVKPANVLLDQEGSAYLGDFGLARDLAATRLTTTGAWLGTIDYAAPEQIRGTSVDARTDVYALAALAFHALSGEVPFPRDDHMAAMWAHVHEPRPALPATSIQHASAASEVIARGMAIDPDQRHPSAGDFARALSAAAREGATARLPEHSVARGAAAPSQAETVVAKEGRGRRALLVGTLVAVLALLAGTGAYFTLDPLGGEEEVAPAAERTAAPEVTGPEEREEVEPVDNAEAISDEESEPARPDPCVVETTIGTMTVARNFQGGVTCQEATETLERYYAGDTDTPQEGSGGGAFVGPFFCISSPAAVTLRDGSCTDEAGGRSFTMLPAALYVNEVGAWTYRTSGPVWDQLPFRKKDRAAQLFIENNPRDCGHYDRGSAAFLVEAADAWADETRVQTAELVSDVMLEHCGLTSPD